MDVYLSARRYPNNLQKKLPVFTKPYFHIRHEPRESILMAHWSSPAAKAHLRSNYGDLLAAARNHDRCRFWLIDLSARVWYAEDDMEWYSHTFAPLAVRTLGHPIFLAYTLKAEQQQFLTDPAIALVQRDCAVHDFYPCFFTSPATAIEWLRYQQEYDPAPGEGPVTLGEREEDSW